MLKLIKRGKLNYVENCEDETIAGCKANIKLTINLYYDPEIIILYFIFLSSGNNIGFG